MTRYGSNTQTQRYKTRCRLNCVATDDITTHHVLQRRSRSNWNIRKISHVLDVYILAYFFSTFLLHKAMLESLHYPHITDIYIRPSSIVQYANIMTAEGGGGPVKMQWKNVVASQGFHLQVPRKDDARRWIGENYTPLYHATRRCKTLCLPLLLLCLRHHRGMPLSDVCLSVAYIGPTREQRDPGRLKLAQR